MNELQIELQDAAYVGMTAQQAFDRLHEQAVIATDSTAYTWAGLSDKLLLSGFDQSILLGIDQIVLSLPGGTMLDKMLSSGGVNFASPAMQSLLTATLPNVTGDAATLVQALIDVGVTTGKRWQNSVTAEPTLEDVQKAQIVNATSKTMTDILTPIAAKNTALQGWLQSLDTTTMTATQVQAYCDDLLASADGNPTGGA